MRTPPERPEFGLGGGIGKRGTWSAPMGLVGNPHDTAPIWLPEPGLPAFLGPNREPF